MKMGPYRNNLRQPKAAANATMQTFQDRVQNDVICNCMHVTVWEARSAPGYRTLSDAMGV